ncbi:acyltransferase family protein [Mucilaginibacter ximonensis]|uniref:Acyltransferase family protein n=1 Tax=Mucilaginibacter ximonensis TaxID=538021 RepID=A0ABW5Y669_9SPHI
MPSNEQPQLSDVLKADFFPSLDGLRGIAIILVVFSHLKFQPYIIFNGALGVDVFFVLSGFLITSLCIKEKNNNGDISLKKFYIRRALRIFPVAYLYLFLLAILNSIYHLDITWFQFLGAALYLTNASYFRAHSFSWFTGHFWSLAVEEQFYLIFPFLLKKQSKLYFGFIIFIVFILPILCYLQYQIPGLNKGLFYLLTHYFIKFQGIAIGCLFSILAFHKTLDSNTFFKYKLTVNIIAILLVFTLRYNDFFSINSVFNNFSISLLLGYLIVTNITPSTDFIFKGLNSKILTTIGKLSYSIYIWQSLFTSNGFVSNSNELPYIISHYPYNLIWIIVIPSCSYYFYEKFFLNLKNRFKANSKAAVRA